MEKIQQVQKRNLISLASISSELNIKEGDYISLEVKDGGLFIKPVGWHEKSQEYFWKAPVQKKLKESHKDIEEGRYMKFDSLNDFADFIEKGLDNE